MKLQDLKNFSEKNKNTLYFDYNIKNLIIDPGIGFGKSLDENFKLLKNIDKFQIVELKSLKMYLQQYRDLIISYERLINVLYDYVYYVVSIFLQG